MGVENDWDVGVKDDYISGLPNLRNREASSQERVNTEKGRDVVSSALDTLSLKSL